MIAVLGRGASLDKFRDHHHKFKDIILVNNFNKEIKTLGLDLFVGKNIIHVVGRGKNSLKDNLYKKLNIKSVQSNCFSLKNFHSRSRYKIDIKCLPKEMECRGFPCLGWDLILSHINKSISIGSLRAFLELKYKKDIVVNQKKSRSLRSFPTTGILAIDYSLVIKRPRNIYLFGFDFYDKKYMIKDNASYQNGDWSKARAMKYYLSELVHEFTDTNFYCSSGFVVNSKRWYNI